MYAVSNHENSESFPVQVTITRRCYSHQEKCDVLYSFTLAYAGVKRVEPSTDHIVLSSVSQTTVFLRDRVGFRDVM